MNAAANHSGENKADDERKIDVTNFDFHAKVFHVPGARFALTDSTREPRFFVDLGGISASLSIDVLQKEFSIPKDSHDAKLIQI
ncbi:MAG: hypothetical protein JNK21_15340, partial [Rhodospirillaceae bacterium]|nr:hypothetical protein [Rhodospirillaceae bacterium]